MRTSTCSGHRRYVYEHLSLNVHHNESIVGAKDDSLLHLIRNQLILAQFPTYEMVKYEMFLGYELLLPSNSHVVFVDVDRCTLESMHRLLCESSHLIGTPTLNCSKCLHEDDLKVNLEE